MAAMKNYPSTLAAFLAINLLFFACANASALPPCSGITCSKNFSLFNSLNVCSLLVGLPELEVCACLCAALKANLLGIVLVDLNAALKLQLDLCHLAISPACSCVN